MIQISIRVITLLAITCIINCSCSNGPINRAYIDSEFEPLVAAFAQHAIKAGNDVSKIRHLSIYFKDELPIKSALAVCYPGYQAYKVEVKRSTWITATKSNKEQLIFHELGHCVLGKSHNDTFTDGKPISIMYHYQIPDSIYVPNRDYYIFELFSN